MTFLFVGVKVKDFTKEAIFFYLNVISVNFHKNQRNFFGREVGREGAHDKSLRIHCVSNCDD